MSWLELTFILKMWVEKDTIESKENNEKNIKKESNMSGNNNIFDAFIKNWKYVSPRHALFNESLLHELSVSPLVDVSHTGFDW